MPFVLNIVKVGVYYFVGTAAVSAGLTAGAAAIEPAIGVIKNKSEKFFSKFKEE